MPPPVHQSSNLPVFHAIYPFFLLISADNFLDVGVPVAQFLAASNSSINPILYAFMNKKFRQGFKVGTVIGLGKFVTVATPRHPPTTTVATKVRLALIKFPKLYYYYCFEFSNYYITLPC